MARWSPRAAPAPLRERVEPSFTEPPPMATRAAPDFDTWRNFPAFASMRTASGVQLTADSPLTHETVLACYNVIAEGCAMLPLYLYRERGKKRQQVTDHPLYELLLSSPCPHMTAFQFWKRVFFEKLHHGNHYSLIDRNTDGRVVALWPVESGLCQPFWYQDEQGARRRAYRISAPDAPQAVFLEHEVFHIQNQPVLRGADYGLYGLSIWQMHQQETLGGALATNQFAHASFANGANLSGMIAVEGPLDEEQGKIARQMVRDAYAGSGNSGKIGVFGSNAKFYPISQDSQKSQLLETRKYNRSVMAGLLRVTAHLINDLERGTFGNIEHLDLAHYKHCLRPHLVDAQQTVLKDLLTPEERLAGYYADHDESELLRGDLKTRTEFWAQAIQNGIATPNEARADFNLPPVDGGDKLFINGASVPLELAAAGQTPAAKIIQPPTVSPDPSKEPSNGS